MDAWVWLVIVAALVLLAAGAPADCLRRARAGPPQGGRPACRLLLGKG